MNAKTSQVVVAYDFSNSSREALFRALTLAARAPFHVLHIVCVIEPHAGVPAVPVSGKVDFAYAERVQQAIADVVGVELRTAKTADRVHFFVHARIGKAADEILMVAREVGADLIIVGTKGLTGVERFVLGSIAEKVVREAGCPVEVARPKTYDHVQLLDVRDVRESEVHPHYVKPHRYSYETTGVQMRPHDWPLY